MVGIANERQLYGRLRLTAFQILARLDPRCQGVLLDRGGTSSSTTTIVLPAVTHSYHKFHCKMQTGSFPDSAVMGSGDLHDYPTGLVPWDVDLT